MIYKKVLVIGGGIAGVQAALDLADSGIEVYLVERSPSIGGRMAQLDKTFPTNDCSLCILSPKLVEAGNHPYIKILTNTDVVSVQGDAPFFKVHVVKKPRYVDEDICTGCGICMAKCPVKIPDQYNVGLCETRCIRIPFPQAVPAVAIIDRDRCLHFTRGKCGNCAKVCEMKAIDFNQKEEHIELDVGSVILAAGLGEFNAVLKDEYGYRLYPNVVTSMEFERILSASGPTQGHVVRPSDNREPKKVAFLQCVGSRDCRAGGEYCSAICCMQAAKDAIIITEHVSDCEIAIFGMDIRAFGKNFDKFIERAQNEHNTRFVRARVSSVEVNPANNDLFVRYVDNGHVKKESFELLVLSVGLRPTRQLEHCASVLGIDTDELGFVSTGTFSPVATTRPGVFVCGSISGPKDIPESVIEASGAASAAGIVLKDQASKNITVEHPPEVPIDVGDRPRIGVFVCHCGINIAATVDVEEVARCAGDLPYVVHSQTMMFACSQDAQKVITDKIRELSLNRIIVAACTPRTHEPLFQDTLVNSGLNPYLFEFANIRDQCSWVHQKEPGRATSKAKDLVRMAVSKAVYLEPLCKKKLSVNRNCLVIGGGLAGMTAALDVAEHGYHVDLVEKEDELGGNARHIPHTLDGSTTVAVLGEMISRIDSHPDICVHVNTRVEAVDGYVGNFETQLVTIDARRSFGEAKTQSITVEHGAIIVATGAYENPTSEFLFGRNDRVVTQRELENRMTSTPSQIEKLDTIVMVQCVGSRNDERPYCSRVCCSSAIKNALLLKEINPGVRIFVLYRDLRTYGVKEMYYKKARESGVVFIQYEHDEPPAVTEEEGNICVEIKEKIMDRVLRIRPDLLVLSTGIAPNPDNKPLSQLLKVPVGTDGFFFEAHVKLRPVDFATDGIFVCGLAHYPKDIQESIAQAKAAASRVVTVLSKEAIETEGKVAFVDESRCSGCGLCVQVCAYSAVELDPEKDVAVVNDALCKGCGTCAASCRSASINLRGFTDGQILAAVNALQGDME